MSINKSISSVLTSIATTKLNKEIEQELDMEDPEEELAEKEIASSSLIDDYDWEILEIECPE